MSILLASTKTGILHPLETYFFNIWGAGGGGGDAGSGNGSSGTGGGGAFLEVEVQRIPPGMQFEMVRGGGGSRGPNSRHGGGGGACSILIAKYDSESKAIAIAGGGGGGGSSHFSTGYSGDYRYAHGGPGGPGTAVGGSTVHGRTSFYYSTGNTWNSGTDHPYSGRGGISGTESSVGSGRGGTNGQPLSVYASSGGDGQQIASASGGSLPISSGGAGGRGTEGGRGSQSAALSSSGAGGGGGGYLGGEGGEAKVTIGQDSEDIRRYGGGGGGGGGSAVLVDNGFLQSINSEGELRVGGYPLVIILRGTSRGGYRNQNPNFYLAPAQAEIVSNLGTFNTSSQTSGYYDPQYGSGGKGYGRLSRSHSGAQRASKDGQPGAIIYGKSSADATILSTYGTTTITI